MHSWSYVPASYFHIKNKDLNNHHFYSGTHTGSPQKWSDSYLFIFYKNEI